MAFLDGSDPLLAVQPQVAVGDHAGGFFQRRLGLLDQLSGSASSPAYLRAAWIQGGATGRVTVCEAPATTDELHTAGLTGAGIGGVLEHRSEILGELGYPVTAMDWR
jgi:hypothetical protein